MTIKKIEGSKTYLPHFFKEKDVRKADRYGKKGGYRVQPKREGNTDIAGDGVFYKDLDDVKQHLLQNRDWGVWMKVISEAPGLHYDDIEIDGKRR